MCPNPNGAIVKSQGRAREWLTRTAIRVATDATWVLIIVVAIALISSAFSIRYLSGLESDIADLYENDVKGQTYAQNAYVELLIIESTMKDLAIVETQPERSAATAQLLKDCNSLQTSILKALSTLNAKRYKSLIARARQESAAFVAAMESRIGNGIATIEQGEKLIAEYPNLSAAIRNDIAIVNDLKRNANSRGLQAVRIQLRVSLAITIAILLVSIAIRLFIYRSSRLAERRISKTQGKGP
jgi:hypothetical protein